MNFKYIHKKIVSLLVMAVTAVSLIPPVPARADTADSSTWPDCPSVKAKAAVVMDLNTGTILFAKNASKKEYPASITKVMTALLALKHAKSLDETVTFTDEAVNTGDNESSSIGMLSGEELTLEQSLYGMLLSSANEVANAIAIHTAGSVESFADMMNAEAAELGCTNTHFANPCGLYNEDHYTSCLDMAKIAREAANYPEFLKIAGSKKYVIPKTNLMDEERPLANTHQMINPAENPEYYYEYCYARKTGYTSEAGYTLVSFAKKGSMNIVCVVMNADRRKSQYESSLKLMNYAFRRFRMEKAEKIPFETPTGSSICSDILAEDPFATFAVSESAVVAIPKKCDLTEVTGSFKADDLKEIKPGTVKIGTMAYDYKGHSIGSVDIYCTTGKYISLAKKSPASGENEGKNEGTGTKAIGLSEEEKSFWQNLASSLLDFIKKPVGIITILALILFIIFFIHHYHTVIKPRRQARKRFMMHKKLRKQSQVDKRHIKL